MYFIVWLVFSILVVFAIQNVVWHFLKTFRLFSACLAFIDVIWHILISDMAYLVHQNLENVMVFIRFSVTTLCHRYFVEL